MYIDMKDLSSTRAYFLMTQTLIPRPIAWVLSENPSGSLNLAPFSYFTAISSDPPLVLLSIGRRDDDSPKDTCANIAERPSFVIHIAGLSQMEAVNASSESLPPGESEVERLGIKTIDFEGFPLPRIEECPVAYGCSLFEIREIGEEGQSLVIGKIEKIYIDDAVCVKDENGRVKADAGLISPLVRLGAGEYASLGEVIPLKRPL